MNFTFLPIQCLVKVADAIVLYIGQHKDNSDRNITFSKAQNNIMDVLCTSWYSIDFSSPMKSMQLNIFVKKFEILDNMRNT
jgi:hypothetical protein